MLFKLKAIHIIVYMATLPIATHLAEFLPWFLAPCRAIDGNRLDTNVSNAVKAMLDRAEASAGQGAGKVTKTQRRAQLDAWELHWSALIAARNALQGRRLCLLAVPPP